MTDPRRYYDEIEVGEEYESPGRTITETDIVLFAGLSGDYNVLHTDAEFMKTSIFGERIAHGLLGLAIQSGLFSRATGAYATLAFVGLRWKFKAPIKIGDTIRLVEGAVHAELHAPVADERRFQHHRRPMPSFRLRRR